MIVVGVSTGLDSFENPQDIGPLYPFEGLEVLFAVIAFALWLLWHVAHIRAESRENAEGVDLYREIGLERAMFHGGSALIATDEEWEEARRSGTTGRTAPPDTPPGAPPV